MTSFQQLIEIVKKLRGPNGCPWDKSQTHESLTPYAVEEAHELEEAIAKLSTHSLRVGLTQDLFASGADAGPIAQALRWSSTATALRYGRELAPASNATAQMLRNVRR